MMRFLRGLLAMMLLPFQALHELFQWLRPARRQVQEPAPSDAPTASRERAAATDQADRKAKTLSEALSLRSAARAILRGDDDVPATADIATWLHSMPRPALMSVCAMDAPSIIKLMAGTAVNGVPGYSTAPAPAPRCKPGLRGYMPEPPEPPELHVVTDDDRRLAFHAAMEARIFQHAVGAARGPGVPR